jgi:hypothetical protein
MFGQSLPAGTFTRTVYSPVTRENAELKVVGVDGGGLRSLGEGDAPAWTADSRTIVAHRDGALYRISVDSGAGTLIPGTEDGYEAALSRDGRSLSFSRRVEIGTESNPRGNYDIWVASF